MYATAKTECDCVAAAGGKAAAWACNTCPAATPTATDTCTPLGGLQLAGGGGLVCTYPNATGGTDDCTCERGAGAAGAGKWNCNPAPSACPATQPTAGSACTGNTVCPYGGTPPVTCNCANNAWGCR